MVVALVVLAITIPLSAGVFLWLSVRTEARFALERQAWVVERRELNQRIQSPETAVAQAVGSFSGPLFARFDDDDDLAAAIAERQ